MAVNRPAARNSSTAFAAFDLPVWLDELSALGELEEADGADAALEVGAVTDLNGGEPRTLAAVHETSRASRATAVCCRIHSRVRHAGAQLDWKI
jgi:hypothetical protein